MWRWEAGRIGFIRMGRGLRMHSMSEEIQNPRRPYAEMRAASAFSFLNGASLPEDLIATAAQRNVPAMALIDRNGVYGAPRFYTAAKKCGVRALVGSELGGVTVLVGNRTGRSDETTSE